MIQLKNIIITGIFIFFYSIVYAQTTINDSIFHQGEYRHFVVHLPSGFNASIELPVLFALHGGGGDGPSTMALDFDEMADTAQFIAVFPQGARPSNSGFGFVWADGRGSPADLAGIDDVSFFDALIDSLKWDYNINLSRVYFTGLSSGGFMTQRLACELTGHITAIAVVVATMDTSIGKSCLPSRAIPTMVINGTLDPIVPYEGGQMPGAGYIISTDSVINHWRRVNNCTTQIDSFSFPDIDMSDSSTVTSYTNTVCDCNTQVKFLKVAGGGHTWPGYPQPGLEWYIGKVNKDIDAEIEIWRFFSQYQDTCFSTLTADNTETNHQPKIYPNPVFDYVKIDRLPHESFIQLVDVTGKILYIRKVSSDLNAVIDFREYKQGVYILTVRNLERNNMFRYKIFKK